MSQMLVITNENDVEMEANNQTQDTLWGESK